MRKTIYPVSVKEYDPERVVGRVILWLFAVLGAIDLFSGGAIWR